MLCGFEGRVRDGGSARYEYLTFSLALCQAVPLDMCVSVACLRLLPECSGVVTDFVLMCRSRTDCRLR
jgi:hypothetical protein